MAIAASALKKIAAVCIPETCPCKNTSEIAAKIRILSPKSDARRDASISRRERKNEYCPTTMLMIQNASVSRNRAGSEKSSPSGTKQSVMPPKRPIASWEYTVSSHDEEYLARNCREHTYEPDCRNAATSPETIPRNIYTPVASGPQTSLCSCSCIRPGAPVSSIHPARSAKTTCPHTGL